MAQYTFIMDDEEVWSDTHPIYVLLNFPIYIYIHSYAWDREHQCI